MPARHALSRPQNYKPPNLLAHYLYLGKTTVVPEAIETARTSVSSGGHSSMYWYQQIVFFARFHQTRGHAFVVAEARKLVPKQISAGADRQFARTPSRAITIRLGSRTSASLKSVVARCPALWLINGSIYSRYPLHTFHVSVAQKTGAGDG